MFCCLSTTPVIIRWYKWHKQKAHSHHQTSHYSQAQVKVNNSSSNKSKQTTAMLSIGSGLISVKRLNYIHFFTLSSSTSLRHLLLRMNCVMLYAICSLDGLNHQRFHLIYIKSYHFNNIVIKVQNVHKFSTRKHTKDHQIRSSTYKYVAYTTESTEKRI